MYVSHLFCLRRPGGRRGPAARVAVRATRLPALVALRATHAGSRMPNACYWLYQVQVYQQSVVVLTLSHGYNAFRGHRTGSNNSGAENYLTVEENK